VTNYIKLFRKFKKWEWYTDNNTKILFIHLLLDVNRFDGYWRGVKVKSGQKITSLSKLSTETGLSIQNIRTALKNLQSTHEVTHESTRDYSIITVLNYLNYQEDNTPANTQLTHQSTHPLTHPLTTNKKEKKEKKEKNKTYIEGSDYVVDYFFSFLNERESERFENQRNTFLDIADKLIRIDKYKVEEIKQAVSFGKTDDFWSGQFQSFTKLRKKNKEDIYYIEVFLGKIIAQDIKPKKKSLKPSNNPQELIFKFETETPEEYNYKKDGGL